MLPTRADSRATFAPSSRLSSGAARFEADGERGADSARGADHDAVHGVDPKPTAIIAPSWPDAQ
jgi:hypothetical protein